MQISVRLMAIADMVTPGNRLVDVGCDHGYLPVYLKKENKIPKAIAMDVRKGPLSKAQEHIRQYGLNEYIETRLSDGLEKLSEGEGDTLVIAGMGGPLMEKILTEGKKVRESFKELILQPQSDIAHFRFYIRREGWEIIEEKMIEEDGKYYPMMKVIKREEEAEAYTKEEEWFGRHLLREKNPVLFQYLNREKRIRENVKEQLEKASGEAVEKRMAELKEEMQLIESALLRYEGK